MNTLTGFTSKTPNLHALRLSVLYSSEQRQLTFIHPQWGEFRQITLPAPKSNTQTFMSSGVHAVTPSQYWQLHRALTGDEDDFGLLRKPLWVDVAQMNTLLDAYQNQQAVIVTCAQVEHQDALSFFCEEPLFVQAGPDRHPRLSTVKHARSGFLLPNSIKNITILNAR